MPSLENLKKQAKLILRWHRERYYPVAAQIRTVLPRYRQLSDAQVLDHSFKLSDAQELAEPQLFVSDIKASCDFFATKLGFEVAFVHGDPPFAGQVSRDGAALNLRCVDQPVIDGQLREREDLLSASMTVNSAAEIKQLYLEFQAQGVAFHRTLKREPWGARTFIVVDPDGNLILFAGPAD
jgi:catechol 2,3-dioxygenase-like lactoylglutathione lyase family enzyme